MSSLVERLRRKDLFDLHGSVALVNPDGPEAAKRIEGLERALQQLADNERVDSDVRHFAKCALSLGGDE